MTAQGKLAAVIGWPVHQSVSPVLHSHWLKEHGLKGAYVALPIEPAQFGTMRRGAATDGLRRRERYGAAQGSGVRTRNLAGRRFARDGRGQHARLRRRKHRGIEHRRARVRREPLGNTRSGRGAEGTGGRAGRGRGGARDRAARFSAREVPEIRIINRTPGAIRCSGSIGVGQRHPDFGLGRLEGGIGRCRAARQHDRVSA